MGTIVAFEGTAVILGILLDLVVCDLTTELIFARPVLILEAKRDPWTRMSRDRMRPIGLLEFMGGLTLTALCGVVARLLSFINDFQPPGTCGTFTNSIDISTYILR